jgi:hypothetical protein
MARVLPERRPEPSADLVLVSQPVSTVTWQSLGYLANFLRGKGAQLVPTCFPERSIAVGVTETFRFRVKTRSSAIERIWIVGLRTATSTSVHAEIASPSGTGTVMIVPVSDTLDSRASVAYVETVASKTAAESEINISIKAVDHVFTVESISCYEQDRPVLNGDATDYGVDVSTLSARQPIFEGSYQSAGGVYDALANADARRTGLFHWSVGGSTLVTRLSATPADIFILDSPILTRKLARSAVTGTVKWAIYAYLSGAGTGTVTASTTSGASNTITITNTVAAWSTPQTFAVDCDDMASADGRQTAGTPRWDMLNFKFAGDGTRSIIVQSISVWDDT